ncbi:MAG: quinol dehydrogenase ferredoxin subunit NapH [Gammaproteobacteria bacterium]|nr:quinol dehydrogenase ferredoxin subunit NapH [Gammaproteobacteria bacterium]MCB1922300.1 quinol dehydrogenase ferredoxin subunit NapH [Gammaproteobacteria bacterium]
MAVPERPGAESIRVHGWWYAHRYLILRRASQLLVLALFLLGPWFGVWLVKGNLASSLTLDVLPLSDPLVLLQVFASGSVPATAALIGGVIVLVFYLLVGGRVYCSWVCPINIVTDAAEWLRRRLGIKGGAHLSDKTRYWLLGGILLVAAISGSVAWELINPVSMVFRGLVFGMGLAWGVVAAVFLLDLFVGRRAWCGHLCPVGAFYGLLGEGAVLRVSAVDREQCDDCMDCFAVCPEHQVIRPALKGADKGLGPVITSGHCTNCGRCIDVCGRDVFVFTTRFNKEPRRAVAGANPKSEVSS